MATSASSQRLGEGGAPLDADGDPTTNGAPDPNREWVNPTGGEVRGQDGYGCGSFGVCTRRSPSGAVTGHQGTDYVSAAGEEVRAVTSGTVDKTNLFVRRGDDSLWYVKIKTSDGYVIRQGYIDRATITVDAGDIVTAGQVIGKASSLQQAYPPIRTGVMTDHIHVDIRRNGAVVNPETLTK